MRHARPRQTWLPTNEYIHEIGKINPESLSAWLKWPIIWSYWISDSPSQKHNIITLHKKEHDYTGSSTVFSKLLLLKYEEKITLVCVCVCVCDCVSVCVLNGLFGWSLILWNSNQQNGCKTREFKHVVHTLADARTHTHASRRNAYAQTTLHTHYSRTNTMATIRTCTNTAVCFTVCWCAVEVGFISTDYEVNTSFILSNIFNK